MSIREESGREHTLPGITAALLEHMRDAVVGIDMARRVVCWNALAERLYGLRADEVVGLPLADAYVCRWAADGRAAAGCRHSPHVHVKRSGEEVLVESTCVALKDDGGAEAGVLIISRDVTERVRAEQALRESEDLMRRVVDTSPNCIFAKDADGRYLLANEATARLFGTTPAGMVGKTDLELPSASPASVGELRAFQADDREVLETGRTKLIPEQSFTLPDGTVRWFQTTKTPLVLRGNPACVLGVAVDITERKQAEDALRQSEQRHRLMLESLNEGIWVLDKEGYTTFVNSRMPEMLGYAPGEMLGRHLFTFMDEEGRQIAQRKLEQRQKGVHEDHDFEFIRKDGTRIYARLAASPVTDAEGRYAGAIAGVIDISRRRRMEQALKRARDRLEDRVARRTAELKQLNEALRAEMAEREEAEAEVRATRDLLEQAFSALNLPIAYMDTDFNFLHVNRAYAAADGQTPEFFIGRNHFDLYPHPENEAIFRTVARTGEPYVTYAKPFIYPAHPERGVTYWDWTLQPVRDASGRVTGIVLCLMDVTEQKKTEQALRASEAQLRHVYDNSPVMMRSVDENGIVANVNRKWLEEMGYSREEVIGKPFDFCMTPQSARRIRSVATPQLERNGQVREILCEYVRKDGTVMEVLVNADATTDPSGRRISLSVVRDITRQKEAERKLFSYQRQLRSLAAQLSLAEERERHSIASDLHDGIGQALTVACMKLGSLRQALADSELTASVDCVRRLVEQIMRDTRSLTFDLSPPVLYDLGLEAALEWLAEQTGERHGIPTDFRDDGRPKPLHEDVRVLLFRATRELLVNVAKHATARRACVWVARDDSCIRVEVQDDGVGFDALEPGWRDAQAGFGLFSIRERLEHVGGRLEVDSEPGRGSRLVLLAPLMSTDEAGKDTRDERHDSAGR